MPKVFVAGALIPTGGAYMAYHLGRILARHFGYELFDIAIYPVEKQIFRYDTPAKTVSVAQMEKMVSEDDLMIVNPSFSQFLFGLRLPGRKISYVQDFRTFQMIDCHFDMYVSVSSVVNRYLKAVYDIATPTIPAFIQLNRMPPARPWHERPAGSAVVYMKDPTPVHQLLYRELTMRLKAIAPAIDLSHVIEGRKLTHAQFLEQLGSVRYFINMSLAEGFGLVPLEAMAMGAMVTGVDGLAGVDYLKSGENSLVSSVKNLRTLPHVVAQAFSDEKLAARCASAGQETARNYGYPPFKEAWMQQFSQF